MSAPNDTDAAAWAERLQARATRTPALDAYEIRVDAQEDRRYVRRNGTPRTGAARFLGGIGIRAFVGRGTGYAYTTELSERAVDALVDEATRLAARNDRSAHHGFPVQLDTERHAHYIPDVRDHPGEVPHAAVHALLARAEAHTREHAPDMHAQVAFGYKQTDSLLIDSIGSRVEQRGLHSTLLVQIVANQGGRRADGNAWVGGERGLGDYEENGGPEGIAARAIDQAREGLTARAIPGGRYRTLADSHLTGLMAHESFGHLTEYDLVASGWSVLQGRTGERLAHPEVTIRDAPTVPGRDGVQVPFDQEGTPGRTVTLLDKGVLTGYLHARDSAPTEGATPTGNARALDISHQPIVRMRNTYVEPGDLTFDEALEQLGTGVYLVGGRGGAPRADGSFMFTSQHGYWVERGRIQHPIQMASIYGNVLDYLQNVEGLTRDLHMHTTYFGGCGKWDQSFLHIGTGGPHVLVSEALVGGSGA